MPKKNNQAQAKALVVLYEKVVSLERKWEDMDTKELETLSLEMYNAIEPSLIPKRKVLFNELLDAETELRVRTAQV